MSASKKKRPVFDPGLCRCCGSLKKCRVLNEEYDWLGQKEIYSEMMMDCFGLVLSHLDSKVTERLVCASCVHRIRDALNFRKQVLTCEEAFLQLKMDHEAELKQKPVEVTVERVTEFQVQVVKVEQSDVEYEDMAADVPGSDEMKSDDSYNSSDELPLVRLAGPRRARLAGPRRARLAEQRFWMKAARAGDAAHKLPISKVQELIRERDHTYMIDTNILAVVEYSYVCPFKCRHNNLHCYYCGETFLDPELLRQHTANHSPTRFKVVDHKNMVKIDLTRIDCRLCAAKIDDLETFKQHIVSSHGKKYYFDSRDCVLPFKLKADEMKCALCQCQFPYFHALNKHMNEHFSNYVCETCGLGFVDRNRFVMHQARHEQGTYPCETCGKLFKAEYNRELHMDRVHRKKGRVYCGKCDARLMSHPQKLKHLATVHGITPVSLPCTVCDKVFDTRRMLTIHWRKDHLKDFRYECQICGQKFFTRFSLNNHMPSHTRERNFKCKECDKCYPRLKTLKEHMRIHSNDRRYRCHVCGQAFIQNCSLKGHMKSQHPEYG